MKSQRDVQPFVRNSLLPNVNVFALLNTEALYNVFGTAFYDVVTGQVSAVRRRSFGFLSGAQPTGAGRRSAVAPGIPAIGRHAGAD